MSGNKEKLYLLEGREQTTLRRIKQGRDTALINIVQEGITEGKVTDNTLLLTEEQYKYLGGVYKIRGNSFGLYTIQKERRLTITYEEENISLAIVRQEQQINNVSAEIDYIAEFIDKGQIPRIDPIKGDIKGLTPSTEEEKEEYKAVKKVNTQNKRKRTSLKKQLIEIKEKYLIPLTEEEEKLKLKLKPKKK